MVVMGLDAQFSMVQQGVIQLDILVLMLLYMVLVIPLNIMFVIQLW